MPETRANSQPSRLLRVLLSLAVLGLCVWLLRTMDLRRRRTIQMAEALRRKAWSPDHKLLLDYLLNEESKHDSLIAQLDAPAPCGLCGRTVDRSKHRGKHFYVDQDKRERHHAVCALARALSQARS